MFRVNPQTQVNTQQLAIDMLSVGFKVGIVELATGLSNSRLRKLRLDLGLSEALCQSGAVRAPHRVVSNRQMLVDAGILVAAYINIAQEAMRRIDFPALIAAYQWYLSTHEQMYRQTHRPLSINDSYVLVRDLRDGEGTVQTHRCACGAVYISVAEQRIAMGCPLCSLERKSNRLAALM